MHYDVIFILVIVIGYSKANDWIPQIATTGCTIQIWKLSLPHQESHLNEQNETQHLQEQLTERA